MPYPAGYENGEAQKELAAQANQIVIGLKVGMVNCDTNREVVALIAYLQRLGKDIRSASATPAPNP